MEIFTAVNISVKFLAIEVYKCINNLNPTYLSDLFVHKNVDYELRDPHKLEQPKLNTKNMAIDRSYIMVRNCGTWYQVTLNAPLLYMNFVAKSLNGASPYHQMTLIYFRCIILDCLWNVLEVSYQIWYQFSMTLYSLTNLKCICAV